jgi:hypothetical protein
MCHSTFIQQNFTELKNYLTKHLAERVKVPYYVLLVFHHRHIFYRNQLSVSKSLKKLFPLDVVFQPDKSFFKYKANEQDVASL